MLLHARQPWNYGEESSLGVSRFILGEEKEKNAFLSVELYR